MEIKRYTEENEESWLRCRVLAFLHTAYFDDVLQAKPVYENPSLEFVVMDQDMVIGLLDIEIENEAREFCTYADRAGAMLWNIAVHPDYRKRGVALQLLTEAVNVLKQMDISYLEAWTRDDDWVWKWYEKQGFVQGAPYVHVFLDGDEIEGLLQPPFKAIQVYAQYTGKDRERVMQEHVRTHLCSRFVKEWT